jgi:branched-chain amino acid transport system ATP-binding protein
MLQLEGVSQHYGSFRALSDVQLRVAPGELVVLLGANGAGKSTLFLTVAGLLKVSSGSVALEGELISGSRPAAIVGRGLVLCPEGRKLFPRMSVLKNLMLGAYVHRRDKAGNQHRLREVFDMFPILAERRDQAAGSLSGGQQQMVAIGRALMGRPRALLLDEPSLGLAPLIVKQMFDTIQRINRSGTAVLLAEQNAHAALRIAHRAYVMEGGRVVLQGKPEELMANQKVREAYIGA